MAYREQSASFQQQPVDLSGLKECKPDQSVRLTADPSVEKTFEHYSSGILKHELALTEDGDAYPITTGSPNNLISDTAIVFTTAWLTSTKGHNRHTMLRMMKLGYPVIMIGPEGEVRSPELSTRQRFERAISGNLFKVVNDMNRIVDVKLEAEGLREKEIIVLGESRGAMTGNGFDVPAFSGERRAAYTDITAPCFARAPKLQELPEIAWQLIPEGMTIGKLGLKLFGNRLRHYGATLHSDPEYYAKELLKIPQLMSGQAGTLAKATRPDTAVHVRIFKGDGWSQEEEWPLALAHKKDVRIERAYGYHMDIADPTTLHNLEARLGTLAEARGFDGSFKNLPYDAIMTAHLNQQRQRRFGRQMLRAA